MTKLLYIPTGEYVTFLSSSEYDLNHPEDESERVMTYEDSYIYVRYGLSIENYIKRYCNRQVNIDNVAQYELSSLNELEIIYD